MTCARAVLVAGFAAAALCLPSGGAVAGEGAAPAGPLERLAAHARRMEATSDRASVLITSRLEKLAGDGRVDSYTEKVMRITPQGAGKQKREELPRSIEDGKDKTEEDREEFA